MNTIIVVGGGAAGFFSAIHNKLNHPKSTVVIIEKSPNVLAKVKVSGGGRCNVTQACFDPKVLICGYPRGAKELLGPFYTFQPQDTMDWFEAHGVPLKVEPDSRVFPISNSSQSIIDCLLKTATDLGIKIWTECTVTQIVKDGPNFSITLGDGTSQLCEKLVLATGSSRKGFEFARQAGHTIEPPVPSLFTFKIDDTELHALSGLSVSNVETWIDSNQKQAQTGTLLVTHWGMSGPCIIKLSAWNAQMLHAVDYQATLVVNWLPGQDIQAIFQEQPHKKTVMKQSPFSTLPHRLWAYLVTKAKISSDQTWHNLSHKQTEVLSQELQQSAFQLTGKGQFKEEFVTCGGVSLEEVNFKTMESKLCPGLHVIGELLNVDGITGGYNFQNAWTTGFISGSA